MNEHVTSQPMPPAPGGYTGNLMSLKAKKPDLYNFVIKHMSNKVFSDGDHVILAKAISDTITLTPGCCDDFDMWFLRQKDHVERVCYFFQDHVLGFKKEQVMAATKSFTEWRARIAFNPPSLSFNKGEDYVVDEATGIFFFVDQGTLCSIADRYPNASVLYSNFRKIASSAKQ